MCTIKFSTELNTFQMDDKDILIMSVKCAKFLKIDDESLHHLPGKVLNSHYTPGPNKQCK